MVTYKEITDILKTIATNHFLINSFHNGLLDEVDIEKMDSSNQEEGEEKKKITEVKTFAVPFPLREMKENITINSNTPSKSSKEQIIKQACKFHAQRNILEAAKSYQYFIKQGFKDHRVYSNY